MSSTAVAGSATHRHLIGVGAMLAGSLLLVGCATDDWMQRSCIKQGFQPGTADYDACLAREKAWSDKLDRYGRGGGP